MRRGLLLLAAFLCLLLPSRNASAALQFGEDDTIHFLQDVTLKGASEEALFLGYMTKIQFFIAGVYVTDAGYVLGVKGDSKRFYHMPTGEELARFQKGGLLPDPLPPYSLSIWDYLFGYSLWLVIAFTAAWMVIGGAIKRRRATAAAASPPADPPASGTPAT